MSSPLLNLFTGRRGRRAVETVVPARTFDDVILPPATRSALETALAQVRSHALIFDRWGLGERHATGLGLAFNFAGPPGTGKTTVIAGAVESTVRGDSKRTVWLVAQSNVAVKNMAEKLADVGFWEFRVLVSKDFHHDW